MSKTSPTSLTVCKPTISGSTISTTLTTWDRWVPCAVPALTCFTVHNRKVCSCRGEVRITVFFVHIPVLSRLWCLCLYSPPKTAGSISCTTVWTPWVWTSRYLNISFYDFLRKQPFIIFLISVTLFLSPSPSQHNTSTSPTPADNEQQPVDVAVFHLLPSHR